MAEGLVVDLVHLDGSAVLLARGEIDMESAPLLSSAIEQAILLGVPVVVDCAGVTFMDSSGLKVLLSADQSADRHDLVQVQNPSSQVRRLLALTDLDRLIVADQTPMSDAGGSHSKAVADDNG
jgi:anti-sigma B factor antagonist